MPLRADAPSEAAADETPCWLCVVQTPEGRARPFCAALVVGAECRTVIAAAPILAWTRGKAGRAVVEQLRAKGYEVEIFNEARLCKRAGPEEKESQA